MMALWVLYALLLGALTTLAASAVDRAARLARIPTRWIWAAAIALSIGLSMRAPDVETPIAVPSFGYAPSKPARDAATMHWLAAARWRLAEGAHWLDPSRVLNVVGKSALGRIGDAYVAAAWIALSAMLAIAFIAVHARLSRARSRWPRAELHGVEVCLSPRVGPAAVGLLRPEIVVPAWLLTRSNAEQRMALAHESSHRAARDPQLLGAAWIALILFPWNPALWVMISRLRLAIEVDCDRRVLRDGTSPSAYGSLLVAVAELSTPLRRSALALADDSSHLKTRILAMDSHLPRFGRARAGLATLIGVIAVLAACEAKEPTAADVDAMSAVTAEQTARQLHLVVPDTGLAHAYMTYTVDSVRVSPEAARRIGAGDIVTMRLRRDGDSVREDITTNRRNPGALAVVSDDSDARRWIADRWNTNHDAVRKGPPPAPRTDERSLSKTVRDSSIAWFLNGVRVDYAMIARLDRNSVENVDVIKGAAAAAEYGTPPGQKIVAIRTKAGSSR